MLLVLDDDDDAFWNLVGSVSRTVPSRHPKAITEEEKKEGAP